MTAVNKIDSNSTGLHIAEEASIGVLPTSPLPTWLEAEPNEYGDFGGEITTVARRPINPSRQQNKGVTTDLDATAEFTDDLTQNNMATRIEGFLFADYRPKAESNATGTTTTQFNVTNLPNSGTSFVAGTLVKSSGFADANNNGLFRVTTNGSAGIIPATGQGLTASAAQTGYISAVGYQFASGELQIDASGSLPKLTTTTSPAGKDLTSLGLIPGEVIFIGGDIAAEQFANAANNGFARIRSVAAHEIVLDKTDADMTTDTGTGKTIRIFTGRVCKNESDPSLIVRRSYQLERSLGRPDDASPNVQGEYVVGAIPATFEIAVPQADKIEVTYTYLGTDHETRNAAAGLKAGSRVAVQDASAFNTSSDVKRLRLSRVSSADEAVTPLFAFVQEITITLDNNVSPNKAVTVLGAFDMTAGVIEASAEMSAYLADIDAITAVRDNADVTFDMILVKENAGIAYDLPLVTLGNALAEVEIDEPVLLPLELMAARGRKVHANLDHTLMVVFFDYLPSLAAV